MPTSIPVLSLEYLQAMTEQLMHSREFKVYAVFVLVLLLSGYFVVIYNNLVRSQKNIGKAWANIDVLLKQRRDELTKLIAVCKNYMAYEESLLTTITNARAQADLARKQQDIGSIGETEQTLRRETKHLFAVAESYPQLKSDQSYKQLEQRISQLELMITDRREFYNASVQQYNSRVQSVPDLFVASLCKFREAKVLNFGNSDNVDA